MITNVFCSPEEAGKLRSAWAKLKNRKNISDEEWLLLLAQPEEVLNALKSDYDKGTSPYRRHTIMKKLKNTNIALPFDLWLEAKAVAAKSEISLNQLVKNGLHLVLNQDEVIEIDAVKLS